MVLTWCVRRSLYPRGNYLIIKQAISATQTFFYLIATHPHVQCKAQAELDSYIGSTRLPNFDDRPFLPYIEAIYREVLRWAPSAPMGAPRLAPEDELYKGYLIPKGKYAAVDFDCAYRFS